jgi:hypothetical protein
LSGSWAARQNGTTVEPLIPLTKLEKTPALVVTASQKSYVNEPLPLGMWLNNDSGKETVTIAGLVEGTELSLGTSRGLAGWVLTGDDLDKTFVVSCFKCTHGRRRRTGRQGPATKPGVA